MNGGSRDDKPAADIRAVVLVGLFWGAAFAASIYGVLCLPYLAGRMVWEQFGFGIAGVVSGVLAFAVVSLLLLIILGGVGMSLTGIVQPVRGLSEQLQSRVMATVACLAFVFLILMVLRWGVPWW